MSHLTALVSEALVRQPLYVRARVSRGTRHRYRLELRVGEEDETPRVIENDDCEKLAEATAIIVSFDLQSRARSEHGEIGETEKRPERERFAREPRAEGTCFDDARRGLAKETRPRERSRESRRPRSRAVGAISARFRPSRGAPESTDSSGTAPFEPSSAPRSGREATAESSSPLGGGARFSLRTLALGGCMAWLPSHELAGCLRIEGGSMHATGFGISRPSWSDGAWVAGFLGIVARPFTWDALSHAPERRARSAAALRGRGDRARRPGIHALATLGAVRRRARHQALLIRVWHNGRARPAPFSEPRRKLDGSRELLHSFRA